LKPHGTVAIRLRSNQVIGRSVASRLTVVGFTRVSIGPAIRVIVRGRARCFASDMMATAASA
jgi:hypothetical protein